MTEPNNGMHLTAGGRPQVMPDVGRDRVRTALLGVLALLLLAPLPARAYTSRAEAMCDSSADGFHGELPEAAVRYLIDSCSLGWATNWPTTYRTGVVQVWAYLSDDKTFCVLCKAENGEFGQGGPCEYAVVSANQGLVWSRAGSIYAPPAISNVGTAAVFAIGGTGLPSRVDRPLHFLVIAANGDTLVSRLWPHGPFRPFSHRIDEICWFTKDGNVLATTRNVTLPDSTPGCCYNNSLLVGFDLTNGVEHTVPLGPFLPQRLVVSDGYCDLLGKWQERATSWDGVKWGCYRVTVPWRVLRTVRDVSGGR